MRKEGNLHQEEKSLPRLLIFYVIFIYYMYFYTSFSKKPYVRVEEDSLLTSPKILLTIYLIKTSCTSKTQGLRVLAYL